MIRRLFHIAIAVVLIGAVAQSMHPSLLRSIFSGTEQDRSKIIKFSHKFHIETVQSECAACHATAATSMKSSDNMLPNKETCAGCHDVKDEKQCATCHEPGAPRTKFENPVRNLIFPHAAHVDGQKLKCETCHADLASATYATHENMPSMAVCNTCHNDRKVTNQCEACHTEFVTLMPAEHRISDFRRNHKNLVRLGALDVECRTCHIETFCQQCHQGGGLTRFGKKDVMSDPRPIRSSKDSPNKTVLQNTHELNYRFSHAIDAKSKQADCESCHEVQEFCVTCHQAGGHINQAKFKPASHAVPGFATLGAGSGGGEHAVLAKRDIESCIACHNVEGRDPTCTICHAENGKVR